MLASFLIAIIQQNTSNLARLANVLDLNAKKESKYRRLKRFLEHTEIDYAVFATLMIAILKPKGKYILALDRTRLEIRQSLGQHFDFISRFRKHLDSDILASAESQRKFDALRKTGNSESLH